MKYQEFENSLHQKLGNTTEAVDINMLIGNIHGESPVKKSVLPWLGLFAVVTLLSLWGLNHVISSNHQPIVIDEADMLTGNVAELTANNNTENTKTLLATNNDEKANDVGSNTANIVSIQEDLNTKAADSEYLSQTNTVLKSSQSNENESKLNISSNLTKKTTDQKISSRNNKLANNTISQNKSIQKGSTFNTSTNNTKNVIAQKNTANSISDNLTSSSPIALEKRSVVAAVRRLESVDQLLAYDRMLPKKDYIDCPSFSNKMKWNLDLIAEAGYIVPQKTLTNNTSEASEILINRLANESSLEGIQAALYARVRPGNAPYYIKLGASYTRLSERMDLTNTYTESDTTIGIISITESQGGDTLTVITGDIITETEYTTTSKDHYYLQLIDIPVAVGYSQSIGNGWRVGGELGAQLNISLGANGKLLEASGQNAYTDLPASERFATNVGLSFFAGVTLEKAVSNNSSFFVSPRFRYMPNEFTSVNYAIKQEYQFMGLHAGYIHSF